MFNDLQPSLRAHLLSTLPLPNKPRLTQVEFDSRKLIDILGGPDTQVLEPYRVRVAQLGLRGDLESSGLWEQFNIKAAEREVLAAIRGPLSHLTSLLRPSAPPPSRRAKRFQRDDSRSLQRALRNALAEVTTGLEAVTSKPDKSHHWSSSIGDKALLRREQRENAARTFSQQVQADVEATRDHLTLPYEPTVDELRSELSAFGSVWLRYNIAALADASLNMSPSDVSRANESDLAFLCSLDARDSLRDALATWLDQGNVLPKDLAEAVSRISATAIPVGRHASAEPAGVSFP